MKALFILSGLLALAGACATSSPTGEPAAEEAVSGAQTSLKPASADPGPAPARDCDSFPFEIVVTDEGELRLNGAASGLDELRRQARALARACENQTPRGAFEGPSYQTVISSMIWPILDEEVPDLELEMRHRRPRGGERP